MAEILQVNNLFKSFGRKQVLKDFNMSLEEGKVYGLLGKNGEGKTTLIRMVMGIIPIDKGKIHYKGKKIKFNHPCYKKEVGYIPEESIFFGWMTINELMSFNSSFYPKWNAHKAKEYLDRFDLDGKIRIKNLSRGMKLKLGLIVALAAEPELLILDDPTSGMDVPTRHDFLKGLIQEILEQGTTILFSSHLVHELEGIIDHLGILHSGKLILEENFEQVKNKVKKVHLVFDGSVPEGIDIEGILTKQTDGNKCDLGIYPWNDEVKTNLETLHPTKMDVESMTLEEIFVHFVS
ncbi:MAG: ABC transporter ATP-binding protein [Candidatus Aminicenantes bacterium]|nr:MAG: ABC transporter ATP-binding protein [Candidatus Aminicenantes bacterium]